MKKLAVFLLTALIAFSIPTASVFAREQMVEEKPMLKYIFDDEGMHQVTEEEFAKQMGIPDTDLQIQGTVEAYTEAGERPMMYLFFADDEVYQVSREQFLEIMENNNLEEVVSRDGLTPKVDTVTSDATDNTFPAVSTHRTTGS